MAQSRKLAGIGAAAGMLLLILDGKTALAGAQEGIALCIRTVIPSLFPFFVLSSVLVSTISAKWLRPLGRLCGIPEGTEALLLVGFLGGYPTGAQCTAQAFHAGQISKGQAERMLAFCNNAGPSFLFGMIAPMFDKAYMAWLLWGIHILSAILVAVVLPKEDTSPVSVITLPQTTISQALSKAVHTMALVCGWVILFRVLITFLNRWILWLLPSGVQVLVCGLLELSNGCCALRSIENVGLRFIVCASMLAFGGLCVTMQTVSVTKGLSLRRYIPGKLLQTLFSALLACMLQLMLPDSVHFSASILIIPAMIAALYGIFLRKRKNNSSIPRAVGV